MSPYAHNFVSKGKNPNGPLEVEEIIKLIYSPSLQVTAKCQIGELEAAIIRALRSLTAREEKVLRMRWGWDRKPFVPMTLRVIAADFGVNSERIRQIEDKAKRKMRHPSRSKMVRRYL